MIVDLFFSALLGLVQILLSPFTLLPNAALPDTLTNAVVNVEGYMSIINPIFPLDTLLQVLTVLILVEFFIFSYKVVYWIIKKIPTIS